MKYLTIIAVIIFIAACGNQVPKQKSEEVVVHKAQANVVTLVNGEKWKVNFATTKGISNMKKIMKTVNKDSKLNDYHQMGKKLQKEFQHIFQRCDMTGEAHNQLHNYLHPMSGWFVILKKDDLKQCHATSEVLKEYLEKYDSFFN